MLSKLSLKSKLSCSFCSKIYKSPIILPCADSICAEHLNESHILKQNQIKCSKCNQCFGVKDCIYLPNKLAIELIDEEMFLSDEEKSLKSQIELGLNDYIRLEEAFDGKKSGHELQCFDHFQELRRQIDLHREVLKIKSRDIERLKKIDEISLKMIEKVREFEENFSKFIKTKLENSTKSLDTNTISLTFRDVNISMEIIKRLKLQNEENIAKLKAKLNEIPKIQDHLGSNEFKSSFSDSILFGQIYLFDYSKDPFQSRILSFKQAIDLIKLCEFSIENTWRLIYRGSQHGYKAKDFHGKCDGKSSTLTILKAKASGFIFGGYTEAAWSSEDGFRKDANTFIFSLTNGENAPMKIKTIDANYSIWSNDEYGPGFGSGDISIEDEADTSMKNYADLGGTYKHPKYLYQTKEAEKFLAGSFNFQLAEIEVYQK